MPSTTLLAAILGVSLLLPLSSGEHVIEDTTAVTLDTSTAITSKEHHDVWSMRKGRNRVGELPKRASPRRQVDKEKFKSYEVHDVQMLFQGKGVSHVDLLAHILLVLPSSDMSFIYEW